MIFNTETSWMFSFIDTLPPLLASQKRKKKAERLFLTIRPCGQNVPVEKWLVYFTLEQDAAATLR